MQLVRAALVADVRARLTKARSFHFCPSCQFGRYGGLHLEDDLFR